MIYIYLLTLDMLGSVTQQKLRWFDAFAVAFLLLFHWTQMLVHAIQLDVKDKGSFDSVCGRSICLRSFDSALWYGN